MTWKYVSFERGRGVQTFAPGRGEVKNSPWRGMELFLQGGGRVGAKYEKCHKNFERDKRDSKKVAVLAA